MGKQSLNDFKVYLLKLTRLTPTVLYALAQDVPISFKSWGLQSKSGCSMAMGADMVLEGVILTQVVASPLRRQVNSGSPGLSLREGLSVIFSEQWWGVWR